MTWARRLLSGGMAAKQTTGEFCKAKIILEADVAAAVDALMATPTTTLFVFREGYRIDLAAAVRNHEWAFVTVATTDATEHLKRAAVHPAFLPVRPEKG